MFIIWYRWRVKPQLEKQFIESWSEITDYFRTNHNSSGSRLHRGNDNLFYGYAQWKNSEQREMAFANENSAISEAVSKMREAIEESFPEIVLEKIADYLV